jgi:inorganic pyrophosphatase
MTDEKGADQKIICASRHDPAWLRVHDIHDLQPEYRDEIEHFFQVYKDLERKKTATRGFGNRVEAMEVIAASRRRLQEASSAPGASARAAE